MMYWFDRMGEPLYGYEPPTGYPDYAESWANSGTLIARMNFGVRLATSRIRGIVLKRLPGRVIARQRRKRHWRCIASCCCQHRIPVLLRQR